MVTLFYKATVQIIYRYIQYIYIVFNHPSKKKKKDIKMVLIPQALLRGKSLFSSRAKSANVGQKGILLMCKRGQNPVEWPAILGAQLGTLMGFCSQ